MLTCPNCNTPYEAGSGRFCRNCGQPLPAGDARAEARPGLEGESPGYDAGYDYLEAPPQRNLMPFVVGGFGLLSVCVVCMCLLAFTVLLLPGGGLFPTPTPDVTKFLWQVTIPTKQVPTGQMVDLTFRNKTGKAGDVFDFTCTVTTPDGEKGFFDGSVHGDETVEFIYPDDFDAGATQRLGQYKIKCEVNQISVATGSFEVVKK